MASGGFHGGSSHSGGHHSGGGGFGGGGFSGGGHSGGGFSGGGYSGGHDHYYGGGGGGGGGGGSGLGVIVFYIFGAVLYGIISAFAAIARGDVPGLNLINLAVFFVAGILFSMSFKHSKRTSALIDLRETGSSKSYIYSDTYSCERMGSKDTWAGKNSKAYRITFYGGEQGKKNCNEVLQTMKRTPRIVWLRPGTWLVIYIFIFCLNFFFYECIIPFFENMIMSDFAFKFFDEFIFYLPSSLALGCPILSSVFVRVRDNMLYECAVRLASEIKTEEKLVETENFIKNEIGKKWYHVFCPNCGAKATASLKTCTCCGSSLEVMEGDKNLSSIRRVREERNSSTSYLDQRWED